MWHNKFKFKKQRARRNMSCSYNARRNKCNTSFKLKTTSSSRNRELTIVEFHVPSSQTENREIQVFSGNRRRAVKLQSRDNIVINPRKGNRQPVTWFT